MESELRRLVFESLLGFAVGKGMSVVWPNTGEADRLEKLQEPHLRVSVLPVTPDVIGVCDGASIYNWLVQVSVYFRDGTGEIGAADIVDELRGVFKPTKEFNGTKSTYKVMSPIAPAAPIKKDAWYVLPATIKVQTIR